MFVNPELTEGIPLFVDPVLLLDERANGLITYFNTPEQYNAAFALLGYGPLDPRTFDSSDRLAFADGSPPYSERNVSGHSLTLDWEVTDNIGFTSVSSYREHNTSLSYDGDGTALHVVDVPNFEEVTETLNQEFRLNGDSEDLKWFIGASAYIEESKGRTLVTSSVYTPPFGFDISDSTFSIVDTESYAVYGDVTWHVNDDWNVTVGGRYTKDSKEITTQNPTENTGFIYPNGLNEVKSDDWYDFSFRVVIDYKVVDDMMLYSSLSQGYKSVGFNTYPTNAGEPSFAPETVTNVEVGIKSMLLDGQLMFNASLFNYKYVNLQQLQQTATTFQIVNAGEAKGTGGEVEARFAATRDLTLSLALGIIHAEYVKFDLPVSLDLNFDGIIDPMLGEFEGTVDLKGQELANMPSFTGTFGLDYYKYLKSGDNIRLNATYAYTGDNLLKIGAPTFYEEKGYGLINSRITYQTLNDNLQIYAYVNNLTDENYLRARGGGGACLGFIGARRGEPRTFGIGVTILFE